MLEELLVKNRKWVEKQLNNDSQYFKTLADGQSPEIMLVGCCDSRFPFEVMTGSIPGEIFVHRNIANQVNPADEDVVSAIEFAVKVLNVKHIVVCGHYECGGVKASLEPVDLEHVNSHIDSIIELYKFTNEELSLLNYQERYMKMVELNVENQCESLSKLDFVLDAVKSTGFPHIHGWVFDISSGLIENLEINQY
ncbi:MAG: carbonic anhydrase [Acidimicrobiia bacterium]|nr:carbonic anhydrase [Acidimicrobiia bacterium]